MNENGTSIDFMEKTKTVLTPDFRFPSKFGGTMRLIKNYLHPTTISRCLSNFTETNSIKKITEENKNIFSEYPGFSYIKCNLSYYYSCYNDTIDSYCEDTTGEDTTGEDIIDKLKIEKSLIIKDREEYEHIVFLAFNDKNELVILEFGDSEYRFNFLVKKMNFMI